MKTITIIAALATTAFVPASTVRADGADTSHYEDQSGTFINPCNGEEVELNGGFAYVEHSETRPDGSVKVLFHANTQGLSGIGLTTGARYSLTETLTVRDTFRPGDESHSSNDTLNVVAQGNVPNFFLQAIVTVGFDYATGQPTMSIHQDRSTCH